MITPTQSNVAAALRAFLLAVLPPGTAVVLAQQNRVPEVIDGSFVMISPLRLIRLATNRDVLDDCRYIGTIAGTELTVAAVDFGTIQIGRPVFGVNVLPQTVVTAQTSGAPGGAGTYTVSLPQALGPAVMASGVQLLTQPTQLVYQLDFHSDRMSDAGDMAQAVSTLFRDDFATTQFANQVPNFGVTPLHADDARQVPFQNEQKQYEWRWIVEANLQANIAVSVPQQYADQVDVGLIEIDSTYPP